MPFPYKTILGPLTRPVTRLIVGLLVVPLFRAARVRLLKNTSINEELEKDLEQWLRASLVLFCATKNMEVWLSAWLTLKFDLSLDHWYVLGGRLLLAIGVVESMPDQQLFSIIHPGPPKLVWRKERGLKGNVADQIGPVFRGLLCRHINRSSPVFAILSVIFEGQLGWIFYLLAITQYLIIGLVTSRDKALSVLTAMTPSSSTDQLSPTADEPLATDTPWEDLGSTFSEHHRRT